MENEKKIPISQHLYRLQVKHWLHLHLSHVYQVVRGQKDFRKPDEARGALR
jgi:hypothetical protein